MYRNGRGFTGVSLRREAVHRDNEGMGFWLLEWLLDIMPRAYENLRTTKSHGSCCSMWGGLGGPCWWPCCSAKKKGACDSPSVATPN